MTFVTKIWFFFINGDTPNILLRMLWAPEFHLLRMFKLRSILCNSFLLQLSLLINYVPSHVTAKQLRIYNTICYWHEKFKSCWLEHNSFMAVELYEPYKWLKHTFIMNVVQHTLSVIYATEICSMFSLSNVPDIMGA